MSRKRNEFAELDVEPVVRFMIWHGTVTFVMR
jgi:hypothetical protein